MQVKERARDATPRMLKTFLKLKLSFAVIFAAQQKEVCMAIPHILYPITFYVFVI